jgi:hypothetical protein
MPKATLMVFTSENLLKTIVDRLGLVVIVCRFRGFLGLYDSNKLAERFFRKLLNVLHGLNLGDMNQIQHNFPAIDLGDEGAGVCYQVTVDKGGDKVQHTLDKYVENKLYEKYPSLKVLVIGDRQKEYSALVVPAGIQFDPKTDIIGTPELIETISLVDDTEKLKAMADVVCSEVAVGSRDEVPLIGVVVTEPNAIVADPVTLTLDLRDVIGRDVDKEFAEYQGRDEFSELTAASLDRVARLVGRERWGIEAAAVYDREMRAHLPEYRAWLEHSLLIERMKKWSLRLGLWLCNESGKNANDLQVELRMPSGVVAIFDAPKENDIPSPPRPPKRPSGNLADFLGVGDRIERESVALPDLSDFRDALAMPTPPGMRAMRIPCDKVRPGDNLRIATLEIVVHPKCVAPFEIEYRVYGENMPQPAIGTIPVNTIQP